MKKLTIWFNIAGILFLLIGIIVGYFLKKDVLTYSSEIEAVYRAFFFLGLALSFLLIAFISKKVENKKKFWWISGILFFFCFLISFPFLVTPGLPLIRYTYQSSDGKFVMYEHIGGKRPQDKSISFNDIKHEFENYKNKSNSNIYLCRNFSKDKRIRWYHFYKWLEYKLHPRWSLPYSPAADIRKVYNLKDLIAENKVVQLKKVPSTSELMSFLGKTLNAQQLEKLIKKYDMKEVAGKFMVFFVRVNAQNNKHLYLLRRKSNSFLSICQTKRTAFS